MNPDRAGLLRAIRSAPDDYHNYLVFADWLQEHGDDSDQWYAESMRLRAEKELLIQQEDSRWREKAIRVNEIEARKPPVPEGIEYFDIWGRSPHFGGSLSGILKCGGELMERWPIGRCSINKVDSSIKKLCNQSWISELRDLRLTDRNAYATAGTQLLQRGQFPSLKSLELFFLPIDETFQKALCQKKIFPELQQILIFGHGLDNRLLHALGNSNNFPALKSVYLSGLLNSFDESGFTEFVSSQLSQQLESIKLWSSFSNDHRRMVQWIVQSKSLVNLRSLSLTDLQVEGNDLAQLCGNSTFQNLEKLEVGYRELPIPVFAYLQGPHLFPKLQSLDLHYAEVPPIDCQRFCDAFPWKSDSFRLAITFSKLRNLGAEIIAQSKALSGLRSLSLAYSDVDSKGACAISHSPILHRLQWLSLEGCPLDQNGRRAILLASWPYLKGIELGNTQLDDNDLRFFANHGNMPQLRRILIHENPITEAGITCLMNSDRFPMLEDIDVSGLNFREDLEAEVRQRGYRLVWEY